VLTVDRTTALTTRELQHVHLWGPVQFEEPAGYMIAAHGAKALVSSRYRQCGCGDRVWHGEVDNPDVLAHLAPANEEVA
jgi:hypothetical protein